MSTLDRDIDILESALVLIARGWCDGKNGASEAVDSVGRICSATSLSARKWTPLGAIKKAGSDYAAGIWVTPYSWLKLRVERELGFKSMYDWNTAPGQCQDSIITVFRDTIAWLREKQKQAEAS